jgi:hypothetical protein
VVTGVTLLLPAGLGENADNKYVAAYLSQEFGRVALITAKLPRTPRTLAGQRRMPERRRQLRFWSMCTGNQASLTLGCLTDEEVPRRRDGRFRIAMSTSGSRPENARERCGIGWLPWGPVPKGIAVMRNMLPSKRFKHSVQLAERDHEKETLGPYYPRVRYFATSEAFEKKLGC